MSTPAETGSGAASARATLMSSLDVVRGRLVATTLPLAGAGVEEARRRRRDLTDQLDDYLLPRLRSDGAPLLVVVGGSTGAGKSTLVNSLLGAPLTRPGVLRPTTRSPVLVHHPADAPWFTSERVFPTLPRLATTRDDGAAAPQREDATTVRALRLAPYPGMPPGMALLDAPDIDSLETANRDLAAQLLAAADLWLFVTTAARYADAVPWDLLRQAAARRAQIALVLDRVDHGSDEVVVDLSRLMTAHGLVDVPLFVVPEAPLDATGMLPETAVADVAGWLSDLGADSGARDEVALATRDGVVDDVAASVRALADAVDAQVDAAQRLTDAVDSSYGQARAQVSEATSDGAMLRGEVLARWQDFVGASDVMRTIERGVGRVRDAVGAFFRGGRVSPDTVEVAIAHGLEAVTLDAVETARERTRALWRADPAGAGLLEGDGAFSTGVTGASTADLRAVVAQQIRGWQEDVLAIVREQGEDRRGLARALSFGVNGLGVAVMVVVFAGTGGLTGAEVGIAGGTALLAQKVLEAAFGDDAVRRLTVQASRRLDQRLGSVLDADSSIALTRVAALGISTDDGPALRSAVDAVVAAARAERVEREGGLGVGTVHAPAIGQTLAPRLRGADLRGQVSGTGSLIHLSPYQRQRDAAEAAGGAGGSGGASAGGADAGAGAGSGTGEDGGRPGFWRRIFGRGDDA
ncbi:dynamin family protein [Serinibacter arcticus]|uniref:Putative ABC iron siderophore transporter n=1 Tax=Serinibacter arcticus TaxID=1655435 RepID=A0A4Z1E911_9MICO|nr:dynamin family protein [Serinibacter arcticus]TGO06027.1 putative ABC iron siderophore transporter [Serinibacter arcticus]